MGAIDSVYKRPSFLMTDVSMTPWNLRQVDNQGRSLLHLAATAWMPEVTEFLVEVGNLSPSLPDKRGNLPFHYALGMVVITSTELLLRSMAYLLVNFQLQLFSRSNIGSKNLRVLAIANFVAKSQYFESSILCTLVLFALIYGGPDYHF